MLTAESRAQHLQTVRPALHVKWADMFTMHCIQTGWSQTETFMLRQIGVNGVWIQKLMGDQMGQYILQGHCRLSNTWTLNWGAMHRRVLLCLLCCYLYCMWHKMGTRDKFFYFRDNSLCFPPNIPQLSKFIHNGRTQQFTLVFPSMTKVVCVWENKERQMYLF